MRVAFDASTAAFRQKTGTGVYCEELIRAYQERFTEDNVVHTYRLSRRLKGRDYLLPVPMNASRETLLDPWTYFKGFRYDVFHGLNSRLPVMTGTRLIATIHDLFSIFGEFSDHLFREDQSKKLKQMISRADHIIVPASFTRDQLVGKMGIAGEKITVVTEGVRAAFLGNISKEDSRSRVRETFGLPNPYLLFVGTLEKRKNVAGIVRAFAELTRRFENPLDLVLVGGEGYQFDEIRKEIENSGVEQRIRRLGFVGEEPLAYLYGGCEAFLFLSYEEGFGIPVIEAMACGAPVVTSDATSLPEVGHGHTWLVGTDDPGETARVIQDILGGSDAVREKAAQGRRFARTQTWTNVAKLTREVYVRVLSESRK